ncbi:MAG: hypothetical protein K9K67_15450 [Bacteriovoracaceae bacterium]|nr:hypothetical protein [Bacteriovoracaceae bacterium]
MPKSPYYIYEYQDSKEELQLGKRIDDNPQSDNFEIIKISDYPPKKRDLIGKDGYKTSILDSQSIVTQIKEYLRIYESDESIEKNFKYRRPEAVTFAKSKWRPEKLKTAIDYFNKPENQLEFNLIKGVAYLYESSNHLNMNITDFVSTRMTSHWSPYAIFIKMIPTEKVGSAKFEIKINNEVIPYRSFARRSIWSFSDKYLDYSVLYSTKNGYDKAPLIIERNDPMETYRDNGTYLVIPKRLLIDSR